MQRIRARLKTDKEVEKDKIIVVMIFLALGTRV